MDQPSFRHTLVWVGTNLESASTSDIRSHAVKEGYRRKKLLGRRRVSCFPSQTKTTLPAEDADPKRSILGRLKPWEKPSIPAWASFQLQDCLSSYQRDYFRCLPINLDPLGEWEFYRHISQGLGTWRPTYRYAFTAKYKPDPWALGFELALQEPLAFRIFADFAISNGEDIRAGRPLPCSKARTPESSLVALNADIVGAIIERLNSPDDIQRERLLNALLSLISRTWGANLETWSNTIASHFRGFRSIFLLRKEPWKIDNRNFELRLIIFEACFSDGCWSFVCPPENFFARLSEFSKFMIRLERYHLMLSHQGVKSQDISKSPQYTLIGKDTLIFRFLSKEVPMVRIVNGFHDESLAQMSVLLLLASTFVEYQGDRRKLKAFLSYVETSVHDRGLQYDESQWCLFWIMFLTHDPPTYTYNQARIWEVLRYMNVVKAVSIGQRARLRKFLLRVISANTQAVSPVDAFDNSSLVAELRTGSVACSMCGTKATFLGAHHHSSICTDPYCDTCYNVANPHSTK